MAEHVFLVALTVEAKNRDEAQQELLAILPDTTGHEALESWWIAEDDRIDGSDNDSAIFVDPGTQAVSSQILHGLGYTKSCSVLYDASPISRDTRRKSVFPRER